MTHGWKLELSAEFIKALRKLDRPAQQRIKDYLDGVVASGDPRSRGKGLTANFAGYWRYRVGDYRVIAEITDTTLTIVAIAVGHRGNIYS